MRERLYTEQDVMELVTAIRDAVVGSEDAEPPAEPFAQDTRTRFAFMEGVRFRYRTRTDAIARAVSAWRVAHPGPDDARLVLHGDPDGAFTRPLMHDDVDVGDDDDEPMRFGVEGD